MNDKQASVRLVYSLSFVVLVDAIGGSIVLPLLPYLAMRLGASPTAVTLLHASFTAMTFVAAPFIGRLSDRIGHRKILLLLLLGSAISYVGFAWSSVLVSLFLFRALGGVMAAKISTAHALVAITTSTEDRARSLGIIGAAVGVGVVIGPLLGSWLVGDDPGNPRFSLPFLIAGSLSLAGLALCFFVLPRNAVVPVQPIRRSLDSTAIEGTERITEILRSSEIRTLFPLLFCIAYSNHLVAAVVPIWVVHAYGWGIKELGYLMTLIGVVTVAVQTFAIGPMSKRFGVGTCLGLGLAMIGTGLTIISIAPRPSVFALAIVCLFSGIGIANSAINTIITIRSPRQRTAQILGISQSIRSIGQVLGPVLGGSAYVTLGPQSPFYIAALLVFGCLLLTYLEGVFLDPKVVHTEDSQSNSM